MNHHKDQYDENGKLKIIACECGCHTSAMIHFTACCQGMCPVCKQWFKSGLEQHQEKCAGIVLP